MSALAVEAPGRLAQFYATWIGKKAVMAATGLILTAYVAVHLIGNLQIYLGEAAINRYSRLLHAVPALLWMARIVLLGAVGLHMLTAIQLWWLKRTARPIRYARPKHIEADLTAITMMWTGPFLAGFVLFHVLHLTTGSIPGLRFEELDVYRNLVEGYRVPWSAAVHIAFTLVVAAHLWHGAWSMLQSVGMTSARWDGALRCLGRLFAVLIAVGNLSIPVAILTGLIGGGVR